ncbi:MAG: ribonuclease P protein component [Pseudomonadota bacterium]
MPPDRDTAKHPDSSDLARLRRRADYVFVRNGRSERRRSVVVQARQRRSGTERREDQIGIGFTATKKVGGAVVRNRAKRRLRAAAQALAPKYGIAGVDYVFIARKDTGQVAWQRLLDDMESALISLANAFGDAKAGA